MYTIEHQIRLTPPSSLNLWRLHREFGKNMKVVNQLPRLSKCLGNTKLWGRLGFKPISIPSITSIKT